MIEVFGSEGRRPRPITRPVQPTPFLLNIHSLINVSGNLMCKEALLNSKSNKGWELAAVGTLDSEPDAARPSPPIASPASFYDLPDELVTPLPDELPIVSYMHGWRFSSQAISRLSRTCKRFWRVLGPRLFKYLHLAGLRRDKRVPIFASPLIKYARRLLFGDVEEDTEGVLAKMPMLHIVSAVVPARLLHLLLPMPAILTCLTDLHLCITLYENVPRNTSTFLFPATLRRLYLRFFGQGLLRSRDWVSLFASIPCEAEWTLGLAENVKEWKFGQFPASTLRGLSGITGVPVSIAPHLFDSDTPSNLRDLDVVFQDREDDIINLSQLLPRVPSLRKLSLSTVQTHELMEIVPLLPKTTKHLRLVYPEPTIRSWSEWKLVSKLIKEARLKIEFWSHPSDSQEFRVWNEHRIRWILERELWTMQEFLVKWDW